MRARDNPFATDRVLKIRYAFENDSWDTVLARLSGLGNRAAIVGPEGSGKTTLLEDLGQRLAARGYGIRSVRARRRGIRSRLAPNDNELGNLSARDILLLD